MSSIEISKLVSRKKAEKASKKGKTLSIEIIGNLSPELNIVILRDKK